MLKITITLCLSFLFLSITNAQEKLFLSRKSDPLVYSAPDYSKGSTTKMVVPSVSSDGKYLSFALSESKTDMSNLKDVKIIVNSLGILIDLERGEMTKKTKNIGFLFEGNNLISFEYEDIWDKPFALEEFMSNVVTSIKFNILNPSTFEVISQLALPAGEIYGGTDNGYLVMRKISTKPSEGFTALYKVEDGQYKIVGKFPISYGTISSDRKLFTGAKFSEDFLTQSIVVYDISTGNLSYEYKMPNGETPVNSFINNSNQLIIYYLGKYDLKSKSMSRNLKIVDLKTKKVIKELLNEGGSVIMDEKRSRLMIIKLNGQIRFLDMNTFEFVGEDLVFHTDKNDNLGGNPIPMKIGDGKYYIIGNTSGVSTLVDAEAMRVIADIYADEDDWAVVAADGRVDGTAGAFDKLEWRKYNKDGKVVDHIALDMVFEKFYTPKLLTVLLQGSVGSANDILIALNNAPKVKITSPSSGTEQNRKEIEVTVATTSSGDPIREIQLFINNKLVGGDERGFKVSGDTKTFKVSLVQGLNRISAKAISEKGYESSLDNIELKYNGQKATSSLYILAVGVNKYQNSAYNLNYAIADASAIVSKIQSNTGEIFKNTIVNVLYDEKASRGAILAKLNEISIVIQPEDVLIFFYAGHGVIEDSNNEFYLALSDVTQLYGKVDMLKAKGISSMELKEYFSKIKAQKQLIILDACQSGGAVNTFAMRGAAEEKALVQLARSSGVVLLASTGSDQFATEFKELGHGVFTYAVIEGLNGKADSGDKDGKITVKELESYINDKIPILTDKYKGQSQYPRSWSWGQDFPIVIVK